MKLQIILLVLAVAAVGTSNGFDLRGLFRRGTTTTKGTTTTPAPNLLTEPGASSTNQPGVPQNINSKTCWWTSCSQRCPGGSQVAGASICSGEKNVYKFNCCQG